MDAYSLAFEAVTQSGSIACVDAAGHCFDHRPIAHRRLAAELVPALDDCLRRHGRPTALAVAVGPGSFTGLRVAVIAARTLSWLEELPLHPVDSLAARAAQAGPGCWWVWMSLKHDTTFHGCYRVGSDDSLTTLQAVAAQADATPPSLDAIPAEAIAIGPALNDKPKLLATWDADRQHGCSRPLDACGVAAAAAAYPAQSWDTILPAYHQASAPELQRGRA